MQGRLQAARRAVAKIAPLDSAAYWMGSARLAGLPFVPETKRRATDRKKVMEGLEAWAAGEVPERLLRAFFLRPRELYPAGRLYHLGLLRARSGEFGGAVQAARELESTDAPFVAPSGPSDLARSVRASIDRHQDRPAEALRHLEAMEHRIDAFVIQGRLYSAARERFVRAELLAEMGRPKEALRWYRTLDGVAYGDLPYIAPAHFGRAEVLEKLGRPREAAKAYRQVLDLWENADPLLQPKVEEARRRLATLKEEAEAVSAPESKRTP
jgi:tetratricopeptide (TPR) repeat protein